DVEPGLAYDAVLPRAQADDDAAQDSVAYVDHPAPGDAVPVDVEEVVVLVNVVVDHRRQQVVRGRDRVHVPGQVEVEALHRHHLAVAAARCPALDPKGWAHRRLPDGDGRSFADVPEGLAEADRRRGLALPKRCGRDCGDHDVPGFRPVGKL